MIVKKTQLYYKEGTSDKVYIVELIKDDTTRSYDAYKVDCYYGRRNYTLKLVNKCGWNGKRDAERVFDDVVFSKTDKGYKVEEIEIVGTKEPLKKLGKMSIKELLKYKVVLDSTPKNYESLPDYKKITYVSQFVFNNGLSLQKMRISKNSQDQEEKWQIVRTMDWTFYDFERNTFLSTISGRSSSDLFTCLEVLEDL